MKDRRFTTGFTIIEVMLFLAITGLMLAGLMAGIGGAIDRERYNDAVTSLHDFVQGQYNLVDNVNTNRPATYTCDTGGISLVPANGNPRGASDCSIVGRFISSQDGSEITSQPIYALADVTTIVDIESEADLIEEMRLTLGPESLAEDTQIYNVDWGTTVYTDPSSIGDKAFSLVMLRLPTNNLIRTFAQPANMSNVTDVIEGASNDPLLLCVDRDGMVSSPAMGVKILNLAANANGAQRTTSKDCAS